MALGCFAAIINKTFEDIQYHLHVIEKIKKGSEGLKTKKPCPGKRSRGNFQSGQNSMVA
jgi:hypothetical protein